MNSQPNPSQPNPIDVHVGRRVRLRRTLLGMSQEKLGDAVKVTFQQIQKYERGANRIGASRLWAFSRILEVPVSFFFDDMEAQTHSGHGFSEPVQEAFAVDYLSRRETAELLRAYYKIDDAEVRKRVLHVIRAIAGIETDEAGDHASEPSPLPVPANNGDENT